MLISVIPAVVPAVKADSWPNNTASAEPTFAGYRVKDIENWDPETDPYSEFLVASVPLQNRNEAFAATQAKPYLTTDSQVMNMTGDYGNSFFGSTMYTNEFSEDVMTFWQYTDYFCPWHGAATAYTPQALYDPKTSDWQARGFEFGIVNIPNPAYTNAAHKNGVMSIACIYFDPSFRPAQTCQDLVGYDNWQDIADQLIEMAHYYGYDGYFMNKEEGGWQAEFKDFMAYLSAAGLWTQWYDTNSAFNSSKAQWLFDEEHGKIDDSVFVNYSSFSDIDGQLAYAESIGADPYEAIFYGVECNQAGFSGGHSSARYLTKLYDENGNPRASYALFCGSDNYHRGLESINSSADGDDRPTPQKDGYQWMSEERERMFWSGVYEDPTDTGVKSGYSRADVNVSNAGGWVGVADFIAERSVINGTTFYTNFNTGHGMQYFVNGEVSKDEEWTNINIQEMMPTWQWWFESTDETKLTADFDYGTALVNLNVDGSEKEMEYTQTGAYNGGSSLVVYGNLSGTDTMHLYKTDLEVQANTTASVTFKKISSDDAVMKLALTFKDDPENTVILALDNTAASGDWTTSIVDLSDYAGRQIAAISLVFDGTSEKYQINIGNLTVTDGGHKPAAPTGFTLDNAYIDGQLIVRWDMADYSEVVQYNLYGKMTDGSRVYLGGIYGNILYVKNSFATGSVVELQLCAVGVDGTESDPATITYNYKNEVSGVSVEEAATSTGLLTQAANAGQLDVTFAAPAAGKPDSYEFEVTLQNISSENPDNKVYTGTAEGDATSAVIDLPVEEGYEYDLKIFAVNDGVRSEGICYRGASHDSYSEPLDPENIELNNGNVRLVDPDSVDWYKMTAYVDGTQVASFKRGASARSTKTMNFGLSASTCSLSVTVTDFSGNVSEATTVAVLDGAIVDLDAEYGEDQIPDAKLREALRTKIGPTLGDLVAFEGALDLSNCVIKDLTGLKLVAGITDLNVSGNFITEITSDQIPAGVQKLTVKDCGNLKSIELDNRSNTALVLGYLPELTDLSLVGYGAFALDLSGCAKLENLYLSGSALETLDITANVKLHNFDISGSKISKLTAANASAYTNAYRWKWDNNFMDLSDSTSEGALKNGIKNFFDTTDIPLEIGNDKVALISSINVVIGSGNSTVYDLGEEALIAGLDFSLFYHSIYYAISSLTVSVSTDGETYTEVVTADINESSTGIDFDETVSARYVKLTNGSSSAGYFRTMNIMGYKVAPQGFTYGGQKPAVIRDDVKTLTVPADNTTYQLLDLLDASYASTRTLKGNLLSGMTEADWIDADYLAAQGTAPKGVKVTITDSQGDQYTAPVDGPTLGELDTDHKLAVTNILTSGQYSGEEGDKLFDGNADTKWCTRDNGSWLAFELEEPRVIGQWYTMHAGNEGFKYITSAYRLQILNTDVMSEEDYLAMSDSQKKTIGANGSYWKDLDVVTGNSENEVTREIEADNLACAQVYRLIVDQAEQPTSTGYWKYVRIFEMELYAYSGQLGANTNGLLKANTVDTYTVSYTKFKVEIANTTVTVRVPTVDEVIALIDAIGTPITVDSKDAIKAARVAYDNLSEDDQKLVTNYETLEKAEADYLALADAVEALIDEIGYVTLESQAAIEAARAAYDALTDELKALVANYKTLLDAEQAYAYLTEVDTLVQQAEAAKADAESAKAAAEAAQEAAEAAQAAAEAAK
ncbi:MAG: discoidin domain-containing protein, partial [Clostridiales bacterium]|nr:discoidin domain-containing protein [Clostridiales bacterium]